MHDYIAANYADFYELLKAKERANNPDTVLLDAQIVFANINKRMESRGL